MLHNALTRGPISAALQRALGVSVAEGGGVERYGETLTPVLDLWRLPEWDYLRGSRLLAGTVLVPAGAATENAHAAIVNPAGSGMIVVVEVASIIPNAASEVELQMGTEVSVVAALPTVEPLDRRDTRTTDGVSILRSGVEATMALGVPIERLFHTTRQTLYFSALPVVLSPGFACIMVNLDDIANATFNFRVRERKAFRGEL